MSGGGAGRGHSEGSAGGKTVRSVGEQPTEAAARQRAHPDPDRAEEGWRGQVEGHKHADNIKSFTNRVFQFNTYNTLSQDNSEIGTISAVSSLNVQIKHMTLNCTGNTHRVLGPFSSVSQEQSGSVEGCLHQAV